MRKVMQLPAALFAAAALVVLGSSLDKAAASTYTFGPTAVAGFTGPFGTVQVVENNGNLDFTVTLDPDFHFHQQGNGDTNHHAFSFNVNTAASVTNLTAGFTSPGNGTNQSPFGTFTNTIDWDGGNGFGGGSPGPLKFTVDAVAALTIANLSSLSWNNLSIWFAADLINASGATGNVGALLDNPGPNGGNDPVPLPGALVLMGTILAGAGGVAGWRRRRRAQAS